MRRPIKPLRHRVRVAEEGIGLVEIMVSILVIAMVLMALATALVTSLREIKRNEDLVHATAVHQEILETAIALDWDLVGFYSDDPDFEATLPDVPDDDDTLDEIVVDLGPANGSPDPRVPERYSTETREGRTYDVTLDIYWFDADGDTIRVGDTKRLRTILNWEDGGQNYTSTSYATRTKTGEEVIDAFGVSLYAPSSTQVPLDASSTTTEEVTFIVRFTDPAFGGGTITYLDATGTAQTLTLGNPDASQEQWTATMPIGTSVQSGPQILEVFGTSIDDPAVTARLGVTVDFLSSSPSPSPSPTASPSPTPVDPEITSIAIANGSIEYINGNQACSYTVRVRVQGFTTGNDIVSVTYQYWNNGNGNSNPKQATEEAVFSATLSSSTHGVYEAVITGDGEYLRPGVSITILATAEPANAPDDTDTDFITVTPVNGGASC